MPELPKKHRIGFPIAINPARPAPKGVIGASPMPSNGWRSWALRHPMWITEENPERISTMKDPAFTARTTPNECSKGLVFVSNEDGTCSVSGIGTCIDTDIKIPSVYNGEKVTSIGDEAFWRCNSLTSITIPNSVKSIGDRAFFGCDSLTSITIPEGVMFIDAFAFYGCSSLTSIVLPNGITEIACYAFSECSSLIDIYLPNRLKEIREGAFYNCRSLTSITIPDSVNGIGHFAFAKCDGLTNITIPSRVMTIGECAFSGCSGLANIAIPKNAIIGFQAFHGIPEIIKK